MNSRQHATEIVCCLLAFTCRESEDLRDPSCHVDTAGGGVGQGVGDAGAVADDVQALVAALQILVQGNLHVIELDLHAIQQGIIVGSAGGDLIQGINHFDNAVQDPLGQHQAQVAGGRGQGGTHQPLFNALDRASAAAHQVAEALDDDAAAQHIGQAGNALAVAVAVLERLGEVLGHQQGEIGILGLAGGILVAVAVDSDNAVGILVDHDAVGVHAEGTYIVLKLFRAVDDLAFIQFVGQVREDHSGQLHPDAQIYAVGAGGDIQILAHLFHPLAAAAAHGGNDAPAGIALVAYQHVVAAVGHLDAGNGGLEAEIHLVLQLVIQPPQHHQVDVRAQVADGGIQELELILHAFLFQRRAGGGIELGALAAVGHVDLVHVLHQLNGLLAADMLVERAAKIIGDVVFSVGKSTRAAEAAHNRAGMAADAAFDFHSVDGAAPLGEGVARLKNSDFQLGPFLFQFIGRKYAAGACAHNDYIIIQRYVLRGGFDTPILPQEDTLFKSYYFGSSLGKL